jgi:hypothetical protein
VIQVEVGVAAQLGAQGKVLVGVEGVGFRRPNQVRQVRSVEAPQSASPVLFRVMARRVKG